MRFVTTPLEYLEMSALAYQDTGWEQVKSHQHLVEREWRMQRSSCNKEFLRQGEGGYRGIVYAHAKRKEVVCAHRGTASLSAIKADIALLIEQKVHAQVMESIRLCLDSAIQELLAEGYSLTFVGHSLGGFLATASLYFCQRRDLCADYAAGLYYPNSQAVVFDPAGSQAFLMTLEPYAISHAGLGEAGMKNLNILHFLSLPNYINAYAAHPGGTIYGLLPTHLSLKKLSAVAYLRETHALKNLRQCFVISENETNTGYPRPQQCRKMHDWPQVDCHEFAALGTLFGALTAPLKLGSDVLQALAHIVGCSRQRTLFLERLCGGAGYHIALNLALRAVKTGGTMDLTSLMDAVSSHYRINPARYDAQLHLLHFGQDLACFLTDYAQYVQNTAQAHLFSAEFNLQEQEHALLRSYRINSAGEVFLPAAATSLFDFRRHIADLFSKPAFCATAVKEYIRNSMEKRMAALEQHFLPTSADLLVQFSDRYYKAPSMQTNCWPSEELRL